MGKKVNGVLVEGFLYRNQLQPSAWIDGTGAMKATFIHGLHANVPEYMVQGATTYRLITDQVGSVRLVVNTATGAIVERIDWDEFGNVLVDTAPGMQPFGFAGGLRDRDTGLTRFGARDYDSLSGRWTAKDGARFDGGTTNLYEYVNGDPLTLLDPDGNGAIGAALGGFIGGIAGGVAGGIAGGLAGVVVAAPTGEVAAIITVPGGVVAGGAVGAVAGFAIGKDAGSRIEDDINSWLAKKHEDTEDDNQVVGGHTSGIRPSSKPRHQKGDANRRQGQLRTEKGDKRRKPVNFKEPWRSLFPYFRLDRDNDCR